MGAGVEVEVARLSIPGFDLHFVERTARDDAMVPVMSHHPRTLCLELGKTRTTSRGTHRLPKLPVALICEILPVFLPAKLQDNRRWKAWV